MLCRESSVAPALLLAWAAPSTPAPPIVTHCTAAPVCTAPPVLYRPPVPPPCTAPHRRLDENLTFFNDSCGTCERILRTPIPLSYTRHTSRFMMIWLTLMPFR